MRCLAALMIGIGCVFVAVGCQKSLPATVGGVVTIDGQSLPEGENYAGEVMFHPTGGGAPAYGQFLSGGEYLVQTGTTKGLTPGDYKVTVRLVEIEPEPPGGYENAPAQKLISPRKYNDIERTDLQATIVDGKNTVNLDLVTGK